MINPPAHPMHVSICNVDLNNIDNTVAVKLFKDDFSSVLKNNYQAEFQMEKADEKLNSQVISKYINSRLQLEVDNSIILKLDYKSSEINEDAVWIYFHIERINNPSSLRIKNTIMLDLWEDQTNLMIINCMGKENGYRFSKTEVEINIDLKV